MGEEKQGDECLQHGSHPGGAARMHVCLLLGHLLGYSDIHLTSILVTRLMWA